MAKRFLLALLTLFLAVPAMGQSIGGFRVPSDLTSQPGGGYVAVSPTLDTTNSQHNTATDPAVTPAPNTGLTNIPAPSYVGRVTTGAPAAEFTGTGTGCTGYGIVTGLGGDSSCQEAKFRTAAGFAFYAPDDPIRNFDQPATSHLHCFFGNGSTNAGSTYPSLRRHGLNSTATGTDVNATGYWFPCVVVKNRDGDGKDYVVKPDYIVIYYVAQAETAAKAADAEKNTLLVPGLRYVLGFDMSHGGKPTDLDRGAGDWWTNTSGTGILDQANAANAAAGGSSTRYSLNSGPSGWLSRADYTCMGATAVLAYQGGNGAGSTPYLQLPDGSDPYAGTCESATFSGTANSSTNVLTVTSISSGVMQLQQGIAALGGDWQNVKITSQLTGTTGGVGTYQLTGTLPSGTTTLTNAIATHDFFVALAGPNCWDGTNLWSPGGYKHVIDPVWDNKFNERVCPNNYYFIPALHFEFQFTQYGWSDRQRWELSSDAATRTRLGCDKTVCPNGMSFHTDWMHGWDMVQATKWMENCLGALHTTPHQCNVSRISSTDLLDGTAQAGGSGGCGAGGRCPQVDTSTLPRVNGTDKGWGLIPPAWTNSISSMHMHN